MINQKKKKRAKEKSICRFQNWVVESMVLSFTVIGQIEDKQIWGMRNQEFLLGPVNLEIFIRHQKEIFWVYWSKTKTDWHHTTDLLNSKNWIFLLYFLVHFQVYNKMVGSHVMLEQKIVITGPDPSHPGSNLTCSLNKTKLISVTPLHCSFSTEFYLAYPTLLYVALTYVSF